jgi:hypothetical protein
MPIKVQETGSALEVEQEITALEQQYGMTSAEFNAHPSIDDVVSEFDAIEWSFLLMQRRALLDDRCNPASVFKAQTKTKTEAVTDVDLYDLAA